MKWYQPKQPHQQQYYSNGSYTLSNCSSKPEHKDTDPRHLLYSTRVSEYNLLASHSTHNSSFWRPCSSFVQMHFLKPPRLCRIEPEWRAYAYVCEDVNTEHTVHWDRQTDRQTDIALMQQLPITSAHHMCVCARDCGTGQQTFCTEIVHCFPGP